MSNLSTISISTFQCPISHCNCNDEIPLTIKHVTEHVVSYHPHIYEKMNNPQTVGYCTTCTSYTRFKHFHCHECESKYFRTKADLIGHLKDQHAKWFLETECKHGVECYGLAGKCSFNHRTSGIAFITDEEPIPKGMCRNDCPWDEVRCTRPFCSWDHFRGRVKYAIEQRPKTSSSTIPVSPVEEYEEDFEESSFESKDENAFSFSKNRRPPSKSMMPAHVLNNSDKVAPQVEAPVEEEDTK